MREIVTIGGLTVAAALLTFARKLLTVADGYEDETGFHYGSDPRCEMPSEPVARRADRRLFDDERLARLDR